MDLSFSRVKGEAQRFPSSFTRVLSVNIPGWRQLGVSCSAHETSCLREFGKLDRKEEGPRGHLARPFLVIGSPVHQDVVSEMLCDTDRRKRGERKNTDGHL